MNPPSLQLVPLTGVLLDRQASADAQRRACESISALCLAQLPALDPTATGLPDGLALSPADAARCLLDAVRTAKLLQAVERAIHVRLRSQRQVDVLYAGCGPLAPLALLLAPLYPPERVRFSLIDIHPSSLACARRLFEASGCAQSLRHVLCTDAARARLPHGLEPDVLIVELMQQALAQEPQLAVTVNLLPQCRTDAVLVPQRIAVDAWLAELPRQQQGGRKCPRVHLGILVALSRGTLPSLAAQAVPDAHGLPEMRVQVPRSVPAGMHLMLCTTLEACDGIVLNEYASGLTHPRFELALGSIVPGEELELRYALGTQPGFRVRRTGPLLRTTR